MDTSRLISPRVIKYIGRKEEIFLSLKKGAFWSGPIFNYFKLKCLLPIGDLPYGRTTLWTFFVKSLQELATTESEFSQTIP